MIGVPADFNDVSGAVDQTDNTARAAALSRIRAGYCAIVGVVRHNGIRHRVADDAARRAASADTVFNAAGRRGAAVREDHSVVGAVFHGTAVQMRHNAAQDDLTGDAAGYGYIFHRTGDDAEQALYRVGIGR